MRTYTTKHTVYDFSELSEEAKQKALENLYDINIDHDWWDGDLDWFNSEFFGKIGVEVAAMYFNLDRGKYIAFDEVVVFDDKKLLKASGIDLRSKQAHEAIEQGITVEFETNTNLNAGYVDSIPEVAELVYNVAQDCLNKLQEEYDYLTSEEAIIETIEANEYEFTKDGELA